MAIAMGMPPMLRTKRSTQSGAKVLTAVYAAAYSDLSAQAWAFMGGYVDLSQMQAGDVVNIRTRLTLANGGGMVVEDVKTYADAQPAGHLIIKIEPVANVYGLDISLQQTAGAFRTLLCEFFDAKRLGME